MERDQAINQIEEACKVIALEMMKVTPASRHLADEEIQGEVMKELQRRTMWPALIFHLMLRLRTWSPILRRL
ncbi:MAG: hypothetical protein AAF226_17695 [Verrucomicrobiota bacterium]